MNKHYYIGLTSAEVSRVFYTGHQSKSKYTEKDCCPMFEYIPGASSAGPICSQDSNAFLHGLDRYAKECELAETSHALRKPYPDPIIYIVSVVFDSDTVCCPEDMIPYSYIMDAAVDVVRKVSIDAVDRMMGSLHSLASIKGLTGKLEVEYMAYLESLDALLTKKTVAVDNSASFFWDKSGDVHFSMQPNEFYAYGANRSALANHASLGDVKHHITLLAEDIKQSRSIEMAKYELPYREDSKPLYGTLMLLGTGLVYTIDVRYLVTTAPASLIATTLQGSTIAMEYLTRELAKTNEVAALIYAFQFPIRTLIQNTQASRSGFKIIFDLDKDEVLAWLHENDLEGYDDVMEYLK